MKRALVGLPVAALLLMTVGVSTTFAAPTTWVVDDDGFAVNGNCGSSTAAFATIPAAVAAAVSGDTIIVCPGNYNHGQIVVDKSLTILGNRWGDSAQACVDRGSESKVFGSAGPDTGGGSTGAFWLKEDKITIDGFLIEDNNGPGIQTNNDHSGYKIFNNLIRNNVMGLYLQANPILNGVRTKVHFNCFQSNNVGTSSGAGAGISTDAGLRNATIFSNTFQHNQNAGIIMVGPGPGLTLKNVNVVSNTSIDDSTFLLLINGTGFFIADNRVVNGSESFGLNGGSAIYIGGGSDFGGTGSNAVVLRGNIIDRDYYAGIAVRGDADNIVVARNVISHTDSGINVSTTAQGGVLVRRNTITDVNEYGLYLQSGTAENQVANNVVSGSDLFDCFDESVGTNTSTTANHWINNTGSTESPTGLCFP